MAKGLLARRFGGLKAEVFRAEELMNRSKRSELKVGQAYGATRQPGSGSPREAGLKGDSRLAGILRIEQKDPQSVRFQLKVHDLETIWRHAIAAGELPLFLVIAHHGGEDIAVIDENDFKAMLCQRANRNVEFHMRETLMINKCRMFDLQILSDTLETDDNGRSGYLQLKTPRRSYVIVLRYHFDGLWRNHA